MVHCSNGHVCLDILYDGRNGGWSPALTINKVVMSLRSMLASNQDKVGTAAHRYMVFPPCLHARPLSQMHRVLRTDGSACFAEAAPWR